MQSQDEDQVKNALGIESWRNLSKEKLLAFVSEMPKLDKDVALRIIDQFPDFKNLALGALDLVRDHARDSVDHAWKGHKKAFKVIEREQAILERELQRDELTSEERFNLLDRLGKLRDVAMSKDSEWKAHTISILKTVGSVAAVVVVGSVVLLAGRAENGEGERRS